MAKSFYSVIQYCPDRFRAEAVNIGLVVLCLEPHAIRVQITRKLDRVRKLFAITAPELDNIKLSAEALKSRIEGVGNDLRTAEDLIAFAGSRANDMRMTEPRLSRIDDIDQDFGRLFSELVDQRSAATRADDSPAEVLPPALSEVFYRLQQQRKIWKPGTITVPVFKRKLEIPYAFKNGLVNFVKPEVFSATRRAETQAATLAINGDLIQKHLINGEKHRLIIVSTQETPEQAKEIEEHVGPLFKEYGVRLVRPQDVQDFAREVESTAH